MSKTRHHKKYESKKSTKMKENGLVLKDFLQPGENIVFQSSKIESLNDNFFLYITDSRILLHRRRGVFVKRDRIIAERIEDIRTMQYGERGTLRRKGVLRIETYSKKMDPIVGKVPDVKAIWQEMQKYIRREPLT
ncbi:MAG: hypothetical protein CW716_07385 [Candidatus Bathyarchaeum sp.]|nr:MAG: hypothetical protein CW716_07385 [Candidatus Bathyarchaeum sp.]